MELSRQNENKSLKDNVFFMAVLYSTIVGSILLGNRYFSNVDSEAIGITPEQTPGPVAHPAYEPTPDTIPVLDLGE